MMKEKNEDDSVFKGIVYTYTILKTFFYVFLCNAYVFFMTFVSVCLGFYGIP